MITTHAVIVVLLIEAALLALALALLIGHGAYHAWVQRRLASAPGERAPSAARGAGQAGAPRARRRRATRSPARRAEDRPARRADPQSHRQPPPAAHPRRGRGGLLARADALCRSRSWRRRLRGARLFALLGGGTRKVPRLLGDSRAEVRAQAAEWVAGHPDRARRRSSRLVQLLGDDDALCRFTVEDALAAPRRRGDGTARRAPARRRGQTRAASIEGRGDDRRPPPVRTRPRALPRSRAAECAPPPRRCSARSAAIARRRCAAGAPRRPVGGGAGRRRRRARAAAPLARRAAARRAAGRRGSGMCAAPRVSHCASWVGSGTLLLQGSLSHPDAFARDMARHVLDLPDSTERTAACRFASRRAATTALHCAQSVVLLYFLVVNALLGRPARELGAGDAHAIASRCGMRCANGCLARRSPSDQRARAGYNEAMTVSESLRSLLALRYPDLEVVLINDGSSDDDARDPAARLRSRGDLPRSSAAAWPRRPSAGSTARGRGPGLVVVDKANGGKADALNAASTSPPASWSVRSTRTPIIDSDAMLRMVRPFLIDERVIAAGGTIRVVNGRRSTTGASSARTRREASSPECRRSNTCERSSSAGLGGTGWAATSSSPARSAVPPRADHPRRGL